MHVKRVKEIIGGGESITVEFKECLWELPSNIWETIGGFLNREGGHLFLGVDDKGAVTGVLEDSVQTIKNNLVTSVKNAQKFSPPVYLTVKDYKIGGEFVLHIYVPKSSSVHRVDGRLFDRNEDGDFDITSDENLVSQLYQRKQSSYSENQVYPY